MAVRTQREDKILFPDSGITKGDVIDYYTRIADVILPHLRGRPLTLRRFPDGIEAEGFFQKEAPDSLPSWVRTTRVEKKEGGEQEQIVCERAQTLLWLANLGTIELHVWPSRLDRLDRPDRLVFDLDPPSGDFASVRDAARRLRTILAQLELPSFCLLTGSKGATSWCRYAGATPTRGLVAWPGPSRPISPSVVPAS